MSIIEYWYSGADNLPAYKSNGTQVTPTAPKADSDVAGVTLENSTTYYIPLVGSDTAAMGYRASLVNFHIKWAAALAAVFTVETSSFSKYLGTGSTGPVVVSDYDTTVGNWQQWNPSSAYVPVTGTGNTVSAATVTAGGSNAGSCVFDFADFGSRRLRIKCVVTTGALCRFGVNGKVGA